MPTYEPPFSSAARSSALKCLVPKVDTGKMEDLPLPGGPATTIILGCISRRNHDPDLPSCLGVGPCESDCLRHRLFQPPAIAVLRLLRALLPPDNVDQALAFVFF